MTMARQRQEKSALPPAPSDEAQPQTWVNRRASEQAVRAANARRASGRRRFVDPTTCERDYTAAEIEFMQAMQEYKQKSGRMFPTWSEVLEVLRGLGYVRSENDPEGAAATTLPSLDSITAAMTMPLASNSESASENQETTPTVTPARKRRPQTPKS